MQFQVESIAQVCHAANLEYCRTIGDQSQRVWEEAPEWQRQSAIKGVQFHIDQLNLGIEPRPSASHDSWLDEKRLTGWKYGLVKDADKKEHPCFVPYEQLPLEQKMKDYLFGSIVRAYWKQSQQA